MRFLSANHKPRVTLDHCTRVTRLFVVVLAFCAIVCNIQAQKPVPQLPKIVLNTSWSPPAGGKTWAAHTATDLKNALAASQPGDVIVLDAGATYNPAAAGIGYFSLPAKSNPNNQWIYIMSSGLANLPAGTRVDPTMTRYMAKIVTPNVSPALKVMAGANHYRLAGLELTAQSNYPNGCGVSGQPHCMTYFLMSTDFPIATEPDSITIDRCYLHGGPTQDLQGAIQANWSKTALIDSDVRDVHIKGYDSQAIGAWHSPGPFKIMNNYLEAAGENVMFGGAGGNSNSWVPSDIEIRNNYIFKRLSWVSASLSGAMVVKNAFELKSAQRVLFDGNVIENVWAAAQMGYAIVLTVRTSQSGDLAVVNDVTITNNVLKNVVAGFNTEAEDDTCGAGGGYPNCKNPGSQDRWNISNNVFQFYDPKIQGGNRNLALSINGGINRLNNNKPGTLRDVVFQHNTTVSAASTPCWNSIYFGSNGQNYPFPVPLTNNVWILDNALCDQPTGDYGLTGTSGLGYYMGNPTTSPNDLAHRFYGNVMWVQPGVKPASYSSSNMTTATPFTYINPSVFDYQLLTPHWTTTSDGKLSGIDNNNLPAGY